MASKVKPIPEGYHTVTPHLITKDAPRALEFYKKAFGVTDPFGYVWYIATHVEDVSPEELAKRSAAHGQ